MLNEAKSVEQGSPEIPQKMKDDAAFYKTILTKIIHGKDNRENIVSMLEAYQEPEMAVPEVAAVITKQAQGQVNGTVSNEVLLGTSVFLVGDLLELGVAAKIWDKPSEKEMQDIYQDTVQDHIESGLRDKSIDPQEIQGEAEGLMTPKQRAIGGKYQTDSGMAAGPSERAAVAQGKVNVEGGTQ